MKQIFLILFSLLPLTILCQKNEAYTVSVFNIDSNENLSGEKITAVYQDHEGFIWLKSRQGFGRYDGYEFKHFTKNNSDLRGAPRRGNITLDADGYFWLISDGSIDLLHSKTFEIIPFENKFPKYAHLESTGLKQGAGGKIYIRANQKELFIYHPATGIKKTDFLEEGKTTLTSGKNDIVWVYFEDRGWCKFDVVTGELLQESPGEFEMTPVTDLGFEKDLYLSSDEKVFEIFELTPDGYQSIYSQKKTNRHAIDLFYHTPTKTLVKNSDAGLIDISYFESGKLKFKTLFSKTDSTLKIGRIRFIDNNGIIWAQSPKGLTLVKIESARFKQYPPHHAIRGIKLTDNYILTKDVKVSKQNAQVDTVLGNRKIFMSTEQNIKNELWFGNKDIFRFDIENNNIAEVIPSAIEERSRFWVILKDKEGRWWAGDNNRALGVAIFDPNTQDSIRKFSKYNDFQGVGIGGITHLLEESKHIWASANNGLYLIHKEEGVINRYCIEAEANFKLPFDGIHFLHKDKNNVYWAATAGDGLVRFQLNKDWEISDIKHFNAKDGLSSNTLYTIIEDKKERLWMSSQSGISCLDKKTEAIQTFFKEDGLEELEFNRIAYAQDKDGRIFFGSVNGITAFYPDQIIRTESYSVPIRISNFSLFDKEANGMVDRTREVFEEGKIVIEPDHRFFRLSVALLDFFHTQKLRYYYKIDGLFNDYQDINGNKLEIGGLPYGRYVLHVKGQGADKRYSTEEMTIPLIIVRPFYLRWWFILLVSGVVIMSVVQMYYWRVKRLQERQKELELLVKERTAQIQKDKVNIEKDKAIIEKQAIQLKELDELKSKFFTNISHELRTPLTLILAPLDGLLNNKSFDNKTFTHMQMMRRNGQKLLKRINELLDLSRLDANRLEVNERPVFLYPLLKILLSTFESTANLKNIQLRFDYQLDEKTQLLLDDDKFEKIVTNYLSNALKFTPKSGIIQLTAEKNNQKLIIKVSDTGTGILPEDLVKIFDRFYQIDTKSQHEGAGIGLALCKELAKVLNGKVWATSEVGEGSVFYLELPFVETFAQEVELPKTQIAPAPIIEESPEEEMLSSTFRPRVLIVEDNIDLRNYLKTLLDKDYAVTTAENGLKAWELMTTVDAKPALVISDIMMPEMDGVELLSRLKERSDFHNIPVIMLTARQSLETKLDFLRIGVDDYLTKPFKEEELKARVANLIRNSQNRQAETVEEEHENVVKVASAADLEWLKELEQIINQNIGNSIFKISDAAHQMALSPRRLQQKIKAITGLTPKQYQRSILLSKARDLLKSGKVSTVKEVMYEVGFDNYYYFSGIYTEEFGIKPSEELK